MISHCGTQTIETDRLLLRRYIISDAEDVYHNWTTDAEACRFWTWEPHENIEVTKALLASWIEEYPNLNCYNWVITVKNSGEAIGYIYLSEINGTDCSATINYLVSRKHWGKGIATEACSAVLNFAFAQVGFAKIESHHHESNPASGRVMAKSKMRFVGKAAKSFPECERISGNYAYYAIERKEWERAE